jgi:phospholipase/lecithinase/hemolysin/uncharacterized protein YhjY with autotransporter beta-barrel domain
MYMKEIPIMISRSLLRRQASHSAAACTLLFATLVPQASVAEPVSDVIVFGDSSADLGSQGPARRPTNLGQMWSERLARALGRTSTHARSFRINQAGTGIDIVRTGGNSYAVNGSTALPFDCCLSFAQQVDFFVQDRTRFKGDELVFTWFTRNDITTAFTDGPTADGRPYSAERYAEAYAIQVDRLRGLGARNIVAFGAESGLLPVQFSLDNGATPETLELLRQETIRAEAVLWPRLKARGVYLINVDALGEDVRRNPAKYGFTATTDSYQQRGNPSPPPSQTLANDGNVFTLDGHFTSAMQAVVADFTLAQLAARDRFAALAAEPLEGLRGNEAGLESRLSGAQAWLVPVGSLSVSTAVEQTHREQRAVGTDPGYTRNATAARVGIEWRMTEGMAIGFQAGWREIDADIPLAGAAGDGAGGGHEGRDLSATIYGLLRPVEDLTLSLAFTGGQVEHETVKRRARLGSVAVETTQGETKARYGSIRLGAAYALDLGSGWSLTPAVAGSWSQVETDGYREVAGPLALSYGDATVEEARVGGSLTLARADADSVFRPYLTVGVDHVIDGRSVTVQVGPTAGMRVDYRTERPNRSRVRAAAGLDLALSPALSLNVSAGAERGIGDGADSRIQPWGRVAVSYGF